MIEFTLEVDNCQKVLYHIWWLRQFGIPYKVNRAPNTQYIVSLSYGKDSIATIEACKQLGLPVDACVHAEVWATDTIPADLPPMVDFKSKADKIIGEKYGLIVHHVCAMEKNKPSQIVNVERERERERELNHGREPESECHPRKRTYDSVFYRRLPKGKYIGTIKGFPKQQGSWCKHLKEDAVNAIQKIDLRKIVLQNSKTPRKFTICSSRERARLGKYSDFHKSTEYGATATSKGQLSINGFPGGTRWCTGALKKKILNQRVPNINQPRSMVSATQNPFFNQLDGTASVKINTVQYFGIAYDEPIRIERHYNRQGIVLPLYEIGWEEKYCREWCESNDSLSPTYTTSLRGGCWFCHNQGVEQLRQLRHNYPEYWQLLLKWDADSPVTFHADGHTVHDFDERFKLEDEGIIKATDNFKWEYLNRVQLKFDL